MMLMGGAVWLPASQNTQGMSSKHGNLECKAAAQDVVMTVIDHASVFVRPNMTGHAMALIS